MDVQLSLLGGAFCSLTKRSAGLKQEIYFAIVMALGCLL